MRFIFVLAASLFALRLQAQDDILRYPLPDALVSADGQPVRNARAWYKKRRPEILALFAEQVFGRTPSQQAQTHFKIDSVDGQALGGTAVRKQVTIFFAADEHGPQMHLLLYLPAQRRKRVPVFLGLNFSGNHAVNSDPGIELGQVWIRGHKQTAEEKSRGSNAGQWQVEKILSRGFALATAYYGDIEPDFAGGIQYGVRPLFFQTGQTEPAPNDWGALGAWAWGLSRAVDYLQKDAGIDPKKIALIGHSRLGKAALWSAAQDQRFALVISNESGKGGASLYRAVSGETIEHLNTSFPHWFCGNFHQYTGHPDRVPVDGNLLLALIAPRPLYVASAEQDTSSNPRAEFLSAVCASRVYRLLGKKGLPSEEMPPLNHAVMEQVGYHERTGKHDVTAFDWEQYLTFAEKHFGKQPQ